MAKYSPKGVEPESGRWVDPAPRCALQVRRQIADLASCLQWVQLAYQTPAKHESVSFPSNYTIS